MSGIYYLSFVIYLYILYNRIASDLFHFVTSDILRDHTTFQRKSQEEAAASPSIDFYCLLINTVNDRLSYERSLCSFLAPARKEPKEQAKGALNARRSAPRQEPPSAVALCTRLRAQPHGSRCVSV